MNKKYIFGTSGYDKAVKTILMGVAGDTARVKLPDSAGGNTYTSKCVEVENEFGRFNITTFKKDGKVIGKDVYNYDTEQATEYVYDRLEKVFIKVVGEEE